MTEISFARCAQVATAALALSIASAFGVPAPARDASPAVLAQGKYLVTGAGQCIDCHGQTLAGGPNRIPGPPGVPWAKTVPSLRGLPTFKNDADAIGFLTTATLPNGKHALRPMPHFMFHRADASAIVAYLRSLESS